MIYNSGMKVQLFFPNGLRGDILDFEYLIKNYPDVILELQMMIGLPTETGEEAVERNRV